jgi:hypothetical protein
MTQNEQKIILNVTDYCTSRLRNERSRAMSEIQPDKHDYVPAMGDVCSKLDFLMDWVRNACP